MKHYLKGDGQLFPKELIDAMDKASDLKSDKEWEYEVYSGGEYNFLMKKPE
ncbi:hypothetical protein [Colwellia sp. MB3u-4]|uniref:hypothetical protein n=1 Tax=Colwellia sp. MB3u-4 TaxID=2759822 RepID=UPI0015F5B029|nr:hypothetical protein [Colwellia sp. MB3u-4]MBA6287920.1 hypothetical protein [Colwellia sp. MB3u-4]